MRESYYKARIVKEVKDAGGYARRIEDQYAVGIPDLTLIPKGGPVYFAEAKIIKGPWGATDRQYVDLCRINDTESGAIAFLIGIDERTRTYVAARPSTNVRAKDVITSGPIERGSIARILDEVARYYSNSSGEDAPSSIAASA